jgi:hypothetical protein
VTIPSFLQSQNPGKQLLYDARTTHERNGTMLTAATLTPAQQGAVDHYRALNVPASWFVGEAKNDGSVEVLALGDDFAWSIWIEADGDTSTSEAEVGDFSIGISC